MSIFGTKCSEEDGLLDCHSMIDKVVMRLCFYGLLGVGIYGMFLSDIWAGIYSFLDIDVAVFLFSCNVL